MNISWGVGKGKNEMPVFVEWDDEARTLLCFHVVGRWTWAEYNQARLESVRMMRSVPHKVNFIIDTTEIITLPPDLWTRTLNMVRSLPLNTGTSLVATSNDFITLLFSSFRQLAGHRDAYPTTVPSVEAARRSLALTAFS